MSLTSQEQLSQILVMLRETLVENKVIVLATAASAVVLTSLANYTYNQYKLYRTYKHIPGPQIDSLLKLWLGNYDEFKEILERKTFITEKTIDWFGRYGPVYKVQIPNRVIVFIHDPEDVKYVMIDKDLHKNKHVYQVVGFPFNTRFVGEGLVTEVDKEKWRKRRALLNPAFHRNNIEEYAIQFNEQGNILMDKLRSLADGKTPIRMLTYFTRATLDIIANVAFGLNINSMEDSSNILNDHLNQILGSITDLIADPLLPLKPRKLLQVQKYKNSVKILREFAREKILSRIKDMERGDHAINDMLSIIFKAARDDNMEMEILIDEFLTLFTAGQETTASAITFCVLELGRNPECLRKIREEVDQVLGSRRDVTNADLIKLEYTNCVFKEALRKWPPAASIGRQTLEDLYLSNIFIPKGAHISLQTFANSRNPKFFPEPEKFKPERFMDKENVSVYNYFPFSIGPRNCIGQNFAQIQGKIILAKFIQNFDFELDPTQNFSVEERLTIRPVDGCRCILKLRN